MNGSVSRLVVCGTDTDVGKTVVSAWLVQGLQASYWKPVQSGLEGGGDRERVRQLLNLPPERMLPEAYAFREPVSPHWAAELDDMPLDPAQLTIPQHQGSLVVETAGGLMVPLTRNWLQIDQLVRVAVAHRSGGPQWTGHPQPHPAQPGSVETAESHSVGTDPQRPPPCRQPGHPQAVR